MKILKKIIKLIFLIVKISRSLLPSLRTDVEIIVPDNWSSESDSDLQQRLSFYAPDLNYQKIKLRRRVSWLSVIRGNSILIFKKIESPAYSILSSFDNVFFVGHEFYVAAWDWIRFMNYYAAHVVNIEASRSRLKSALDYIKAQNKTRAYVFGTGPSLALAAESSFKDGVCIVCNTIVRDKNLFDKLSPSFIVAGDALYHFSFTKFATAFRDDLHQRLIEANVYFVYPALFDVLVQREFSDMSSKLIPIPVGVHDKIDCNLMDSYELPGLGNVLALLQLPLACTVANNIYLWGFDGRSPSDTVSPFWENSAKHSYSELMYTLKDAFPVFYDSVVPNNDSSKYINSVHGDRLEQLLRSAEMRGYSFEMLHPSWTDVFSKRYRGTISPETYSMTIKKYD
jgi:hypothetical protein